jgi:hypothetical protein
MKPIRITEIEDSNYRRKLITGSIVEKATPHPNTDNSRMRRACLSWVTRRRTDGEDKRSLSRPEVVTPDEPRKATDNENPPENRNGASISVYWERRINADVGMSSRGRALPEPLFG